MSSADEDRTIEMEKTDENVPQTNVNQDEESLFKVPKAKDPIEIEREQEAKLKAKYGGLKKAGAGSGLLQKRLQKGQKYFDSGDYNMAKAKMNNPKKPLAPTEKLLLQESIGDEIPTPETVEFVRKPSLSTSKLLNP